MAGSGEDDELPNLDDDEGGNESTVAMEAPSFAAGAPLPISNPPPPAAPAASPRPAAAAPASARSPAAPPARPPGVPAPGAARPAFAGAPPRPLTGAGNRSVGKSTVIGLAPPGARPGAPAPSAPRTPAAPVSPRVPPPAQAAAPAPAPARAAASAPPDDAPGEGATMASEPGAMAAYANAYPLDPPAAKPRPAAPNVSPLAATAFAPPSQSAPNGEGKSSGENEAATVTVPKDVLDRVRADPKAVLEEEKQRAIPRIVHDEDADGGDETKAVPREELLRPQVARVAISANAGGDDATLAVAPGSNEAANIGASIGEVLQHAPPPDGGGFPSVQGFPPPSFGGPMQPQHVPSPSYMGPGPGQQGMSQGPMGMPPQQPWSSSHMPAAPHGQGGMMPPYGGGPMMQQPPFGGNPRSQVPTNWAPLQVPAAQKPSKISGQMILLFVVGFVCLAIFVTGIVLFMTTKF